MQEFLSSDLLTLVRWLHIISGAMWLGEVLTVNVVLLPILKASQDSKVLLQSVFPAVFKLASILAAITVIMGGIMLYGYTGFDLQSLTDNGVWGYSIIIGGILGLGLAVFHFTIEGKFEKQIRNRPNTMHKRLKIIPRVGIIVLIISFLLMLNASHLLIR